MKMKVSNRNQNGSYNHFLDQLEEDVMGFLNEVQLNFPQATSLASGRPDESFFDLEHMQDHVAVFVEYMAASKKINREQVLRDLGQYNRTKGIINELVAKYLKKDYGIEALPRDTIIGVGTQEGMALSVMALCNREEDVLLIEDPCYVGIGHYSLLNGYDIAPVQVTADGICLAQLEAQIMVYREKGKKVKLVYVIPDFQNPTGATMPIKNRIRLLEMADEYGFLIIEDNAYGDFVLEGRKFPTLKSLDRNNNVIYLHSFSKILHPSLRVGVIVANKVFNGAKALSDLMAKLKGYTTVNTPSLTQAILGGMLIQHDFSFQEYNKAKLENLKVKKIATMAALDKYFSRSDSALLNGVTWNAPKGGYFLTLKCPTKITKNDVLTCAREHDVIFTPMSFFYLSEGGANEIRIAYSHVKKSSIDKAIKNLATFLSEKLSRETLEKQKTLAAH